MAADSAIADIGQTLIEMLRDRMEDLIGRDEVALASPASVGGNNDARLTLYLYRITMNADLNNARRQDVDRTSVRNPPLALDLYYLLTAHPSTGGDDETGRTSEQHAVLGRAMQTLHDNAILRGSELSGSLAGDPEEEVRITVTPTEQPSFDAMVSLWGTFPDQPFQPSLSYVVSPVDIDSERTTDVRRVVEKEERYYDDLDDERGVRTHE